MLPGIVTALVLWVLPTPDGLQADRHAMAARGFANLWAAGRAAGSGRWALLADPVGYAGWVRQLFGPGMPEQVWGYPPTALLLAVPFAALPLVPGFLLWTLGGLLAFWLALRGGGLSRHFALLAMASPAVLQAVLAGQSGALAGAALVGGLLLAGRAPVASGLLLGLLSLKPQLALLVPLLLLAIGDRRALLVAGGTALGLAGLAALCFGDATWLQFLQRSGPAMSGILQRPWIGSPAQLDMASVFMAARALGAPLALAWAAQLLVGVLAAAAAWRAWRTGGSPALRVALAIPLCLLATPYLHDYDLPPLAAAVAILTRRACNTGWLRGERAVMALAWVWPGAALLVGSLVPGLGPLAPLLGVLALAGTAIYAGRRLSRQIHQG